MSIGPTETPPMTAIAKDLDRLGEMLLGVAPSFVRREGFAWFVHDGPPIPKARARTLKGYAYTPARTVAAERLLAHAYTLSRQTAEPLAGNVAVAMIFYRPDRRRMDTDNLVKLVLDAGNRARVWGDDSQVTAHAAVLELDRERPRTVVAYCPIESTLNRRIRRSRPSPRRSMRT